MTLLELVARLRDRLDDTGGDTGPAPTGFSFFWEADDSGALWSNLELTRFLNSACLELAYRVPIVDSEENETTRIYLYPNTARYAIDPRVLAIDAVVLASSGVALRKISDANSRNYQLDRDTRYQDPDGGKWYREDMSTLQITVAATPTVADVLKLSVRRTPLDTLDWAQRTQQEPEFPPQFQEALLHWAAMQAYLKRDTDTTNMELAGYFQGQFTDQVGPRVNFQLAKIHQEVAGVRLRTRATYY